MITTCPKCGLIYDDTYRWTFCPHNKFAMACTTTRQRQDGTTESIIVTNLEQQNAFLQGYDAQQN